mgnify:CR=1 FL=1
MNVQKAWQLRVEAMCCAMPRFTLYIYIFAAFLKLVELRISSVCSENLSQSKKKTWVTPYSMCFLRYLYQIWQTRQFCAYKLYWAAKICYIIKGGTSSNVLSSEHLIRYNYNTVSCSSTFAPNSGASVFYLVLLNKKLRLQTKIQPQTVRAVYLSLRIS